jgi:hypothetical protein
MTEIETFPLASSIASVVRAIAIAAPSARASI